MEQLEFNILFRWFVGLSMHARLWDVTVFSKNRDRLLRGDIAGALFKEIVEQARNQGLVSEEHFSVDGTLLEAWASQKSFQKKGRKPGGTTDSGFRGGCPLPGQRPRSPDPPTRSRRERHTL